MAKKKNYKEGYLDHFLSMYSIHFSENKQLKLDETSFEQMLVLYKKHHNESDLTYLKEEIAQAQGSNDWDYFASLRNKFEQGEDVERLAKYVVSDE
jgi:hypothetical protein